MNIPFREEDIPVLTEVIEETATDAPAAEAWSATPSGIVQAPDRPQFMPQLSEIDREALERRLEERILRQLQARIDAVLEEQVRDVLADVLQTAVTRLADDIRGQLHESMERIVANAVAQEVAHLQKSNH